MGTKTKNNKLLQASLVSALAVTAAVVVPPTIEAQAEVVDGYSTYKAENGKEFIVDGISYGTFTNGIQATTSTTGSITGWTPPSDWSIRVDKKLIIPAYISKNAGGYFTIVNFSNNLFSGKGITELILPNSIKEIGRSAFYNNKLKTVKLPQELVTLDASAFSKNELNSTNLSELKKLKSIGIAAFSDNNLSEVIVPYGVTTVDSYAFGDNPNLVYGELPETLTSMGSLPFYNVFIPSNNGGRLTSYSGIVNYKNIYTNFGLDSSIYTHQGYFFGATPTLADSIYASRPETKLNSYVYRTSAFNIFLYDLFEKEEEDFKLLTSNLQRGYRHILNQEKARYDAEYAKLGDWIHDYKKAFFSEETTLSDMEAFRPNIELLGDAVALKDFQNRLIELDLGVKINAMKPLISSKLNANTILEVERSIANVTNANKKAAFLESFNPINAAYKKYANAVSAISTAAKTTNSANVQLARTAVGYVVHEEDKTNLTAQVDSLQLTVAQNVLLVAEAKVWSRLTATEIANLNNDVNLLAESEPTKAGLLSRAKVVTDNYNAYQTAYKAIQDLTVEPTDQLIDSAIQLVEDTIPDEGLSKVDRANLLKLLSTQRDHVSADKLVLIMEDLKALPWSQLTKESVDAIRNISIYQNSNTTAYNLLNAGIKELDLRVTNYKAANDAVAIITNSNPTYTQLNTAKTAIAKINHTSDKEVLTDEFNVALNKQLNYITIDMMNADWSTLTTTILAEAKRVVTLASNPSDYQEELNELTRRESLYRAADNAVKTVERLTTFKDSDIDNALSSVKLVDNYNDKVALEDRIEVLRELVDKSETQVALTKAEALLQSKLTEAELTAINKLIQEVNLQDQADYSDRLNILYTRMASFKVAYDAYLNVKDRSDLTKAKELVTALHKDADRAALLQGLASVEIHIEEIIITSDLLTPLENIKESEITIADLEKVKNNLEIVDDNLPQKQELEAKIKEIEDRLAIYNAAVELLNKLKEIKTPSDTEIKATLEAIKLIVSVEDRRDLTAEYQTLVNKISIDRVVNLLTSLEETTSSNITKAQLDALLESINKLSGDKTSYLAQLESIKTAYDKYKDVELLVIKAEETSKLEDISNARDAVATIVDADDRKELEDRLDAFEVYMEDLVVSDKVDAMLKLLESTRDKDLTSRMVSSVKVSVNTVNIVEHKAAYLERIIYVEKRLLAYNEALRAIDAARVGKTQELIDDARKAVKNVLTFEGRNELNAVVDTLTVGDEPSPAEALERVIYLLESAEAKRISAITDDIVKELEDAVSKLSFTDRKEYSNRLATLKEDRRIYNKAVDSIAEAKADPTDVSIQTATDNIAKVKDSITRKNLEGQLKTIVNSLTEETALKLFEEISNTTPDKVDYATLSYIEDYAKANNNNLMQQLVDEVRSDKKNYDYLTNLIKEYLSTDNPTGEMSSQMQAHVEAINNPKLRDKASKELSSALKHNPIKTPSGFKQQLESILTNLETLDPSLVDQSMIDLANGLINDMPADTRADYFKRLDVGKARYKAYTNAVAALSKAESDTSESNIADATAAIALVVDGIGKNNLNKRLASIGLYAGGITDRDKAQELVDAIYYLPVQDISGILLQKLSEYITLSGDTTHQALIDSINADKLKYSDIRNQINNYGANGYQDQTKYNAIATDIETINSKPTKDSLTSELNNAHNALLVVSKPEPTDPPITNPSPPTTGDTGTPPVWNDNVDGDVDVNLVSGGLSLRALEVEDFGTIKIDEVPKIHTTNFEDTIASFTATDSRGTRAGWSVTVSATTFKEKGGKGFELPKGSLALNLATVGLSPVGTADRPDNLPSLTQAEKLIIDNGTVTVATALQGRGMGSFNFTFSPEALALVVDPATALINTDNYANGYTPYQSTLTWSMVSDPSGTFTP